MTLFGADRSTGDIILILLTMTAGFMLVCAVIGLTVLIVFRPDIDSTAATTSLANALLAVLGFVVGRSSNKQQTIYRDER